MAVESLEEVIMPTAMMGVCAILTDHGCTALPQRRHQTVMAEPDGMNPEVSHSAIYRGKTRENQLDFLSAAVKCGLGERGFHGALLTDAFGPMLRYCFVLTDVELEPSAMYEPHLCDRCGPVSYTHLIQQFYREILSVADEYDGKLPNRVVFFMDEFGTLPKIESAEMMFSAGRSRRLTMVPILSLIHI